MGAKKKVLVVDDELYVRIIYKEELEDLGLEVVTSDGGEDIAALLDRERPDAVTLDIRLGLTRSGLDMLGEIKALRPELPVILCSAYEQFQNEPAARDADAYVVKSPDTCRYLDEVSQVLSL